jgi:hypothetical protein
MKKESLIGYAIGSALGVAAVGLLLLPASKPLLAAGPMNTGHESLSCESCHKPAEGTMRQQLQANLRHALGLRSSEVDFVHRPVGNEACLECHSRPKDVHPVSRFLEPRFAEARRELRPQLCGSCHREHEGRRVTLGEATFCRHCHQEVKIAQDPLTVSHQELASRGDWRSCLGCHDFHGNHVMKLKTSVAEALPPEYVLRYFQGGPSPYSREKLTPARSPAP